MLGAVLAGGRGRRLGGEKATASLAGRPLVSYPLSALGAVCERVVVVTKPATRLPEEVERWDEPTEPRHPLTGIVAALERAGAPVLVCAADMPFVGSAACRAMLDAAEARTESPAVVARAGGRLQPLLGVYRPEALDGLRAAPPGGRLTDAVESLAPALFEMAPAVVRSVNTPEDLRAAEAELARGRA